MVAFSPRETHIERREKSCRGLRVCVVTDHYPICLKGVGDNFDDVAGLALCGLGCEDVGELDKLSITQLDGHQDITTTVTITNIPISLILGVARTRTVVDAVLQNPAGGDGVTLIERRSVGAATNQFTSIATSRVLQDGVDNASGSGGVDYDTELAFDGDSGFDFEDGNDWDVSDSDSSGDVLVTIATH